MASSLAAGRVYPMEDMSAAGASAAVTSSSYSSRLHIGKPRMETSPTLENAYWSGMRKRVGLSRLDAGAEVNEDRKYAELQEELSSEVRHIFHQNECMMFIPKPGQNVKSNNLLKCHCGEILSLHVWGRSFREPGLLETYVHEDFIDLARNPTGTPPKDIPKVDWTAKMYIKEQPSVTCGKMNFNLETAGGKKPAKYLRLSNTDSADACLEFMKEFWHIMEPNPPNLVISVVGGAKNFRLDGEMRETFSNGLIKAAKTTNAWLITSGFNMGVMKSVGQAVREGQAFQWDNDRMTHLLRCIAIAPWGYVYNRRVLEVKSRSKMNAYYRTSNMILHGQPVPLNPDHTHFIFVDDGFRNRYGGSADFRARFERKLCTPKSESGYGIPVVMIVVEGGSDAIQDVCQSLKEGIPVVVCTGTGRAADILHYAHKFTSKDITGQRSMNERQRKTLEDRVIKAYSKNWGNKAEEELAKVMEKIDECMMKDNLMVFFDLRREEDLDVAILSVLTKVETYAGEKHRLKQLELALTWNRADIAQSEIFREDRNWSTDELNTIMTKALLEDKVSFVRLLLNQGVSMKEYLTVPRLEHLYNSIPKQGFLMQILKRRLKKDAFSIEDIGKFLRRMLDRFDDDKITPNSPSSIVGKKKLLETTDTEAEEDRLFQRPYKQLLIWAVLLNRSELAQFFWEMGEEPITSALSVSFLCVKMHRLIPKYLHSIRLDFLNMRKTFVTLATKVLDECHEMDPEKAVMLVERKSPSWSRMTCLQIAAAANDQMFVSSVACQNSVNNVWKNGVLSDWRSVFVCCLFPFLVIPLIQTVNLGELGSRYFGKRQKMLTFLTAPITKFCYYMLSYILFLCGYTYMLLVDFQEYPSPLELILMLWILSFLIGEIHSFIIFPSASLRGKIRDWFTFLNRLELANLVLAFIAFTLRVNSDYYKAAKTLYCVNAVIFYIRIIKVYIANSHLGPKLYMIFRMVEELMMFVVVLVVFLLAYGVASQGLLYMKREPSFDIVKDIIQFPYWQLYGEIFLEEIETDQACLDQLGNGTSILPFMNTCRVSYWLVYILLGLYLLVGNVLLLNLLIAIFSHVFNMVEENSIEIWKYQMYFLVMEFQGKAKLPPPLCLFDHMFSLFRYIARKSCCKKAKRAELFSQHHLVYLALFEKEMMSNYLRRLKHETMDSMQRKFVKLGKRVDMLSKMIEDKHVEDENAMQGSIRLSDGLRILSAVGLGESKSAPSLMESTPEVEPAQPVSGTSLFHSLLKDDGAEAKGGKEVEPAAQDGEEKVRETKVAFSLEEEEEKKKKRHKKKKKKEKRSKSSDRYSSPEKKELNINIPEANTKQLRDKHISDENNEFSDSARAFRRSVSESPPPRSSPFFMRPPPAALKAPISLLKTKPPGEETQVTLDDMGDEPDLDESDMEEEKVKSPRIPRRRLSRGKLNMLSSVSENRTLEVAQRLEYSSDDSFARHLPPPGPPHHHRPRKNKHKQRSPRPVRTDSD